MDEMKGLFLSESKRIQSYRSDSSITVVEPHENWVYCLIYFR